MRAARQKWLGGPRVHAAARHLVGAMAVVAVVAGPARAAGAVPEGPRQAVEVAPFDLVEGHLRLTLARRLCPHLVGVLSPKGGLAGPVPHSTYLWPLGGDMLGLEAGVRMFPWGGGLAGTFVEPRASYTYGFHFHRHRLAVHAHLGHQWIWPGGFSALVSAGMRYHNDFNRQGFQAATAVLSRDFDNPRGFAPEVNLTLGYAF